MSLAFDLFHLDIPLIEKILRPVVVYLFLIVILRIAGKRELAQINTFDLVVLLTLSNTVQNAIIGSDNSLLGGLVGATTLVATNAVVVHFMYGHPLISKLMEGESDLLVDQGRVLEQQLQREGITRQELEASAHRQGFASLKDVDKATIEASGAICFIGKQPSEEVQRHEQLLNRLEALSAEMAEIRRSLKA